YASWGWTTGPRHLTGLVPFMLLPAAMELEQSRGWLRGVIVGLALSSMLVTGALTFVNYIPDDVSEGVFGLFVPLAWAGDVVPTALSFVVGPGATTGWLVIVAAIAVAILAAALVLEARVTPIVSAIVVAVGLLILHRVAYRDTEQDRGARALLREV